MVRLFRRVSLLVSILALAALCAVALTSALPDLAGRLLRDRSGATEESPTGAPQAQANVDTALTYYGAVQATEQRSVVLQVGGQVQDIMVEVGDTVQAGDELARLDTTYLDLDLERAEINVELARVALLEVGTRSSQGDLAVAQANLSLAKTALAKLQAGATEGELAATRSSAAAAWSRYNEIRAGPSPSRLDQLRANLEKAQIAVTQAQRAYDEVKWRPDVGRTPQAGALQSATIDLNAAQGAFDEAAKPAAQSEVQSALAAAQSAQNALDRLAEGVPEGEIVLAEANVSAAEAALLQTQELSGSSDVRSAELHVRQALVSLEEARLHREAAQIRSPMTGTVLAMNVEAGQQGSAGSTMAIVGDLSSLQLVVQVRQDQVNQIGLGDPVAIALFGTQDAAITGTVEKISPISIASTGASTFPVTVFLPESGTDQFSPGVLVSATFPGR